ncbi:hypothetical protein [Adlercreutzia sp. ZJ138]|uniref:hypothetical protein n=1 Tax=Adlercreutzia sp. ZJ138 TaxID=2709405 RepID=UPI0013EC0E41|nr:hypothetical protein [Adlercreutzia sp. ZJ138]
MTTKTFSGRVDADTLAFADALAQRDYGLSFGQYCGTVLLGSIQATGSMPQLPKSVQSKKSHAATIIKEFTVRGRNNAVGHMSDAEVRDMIASRYE